MPRGLLKASAYYNNLEARKDWAKIAKKYPEIAVKFAPPAGAGFRKIDKCIAKVRAAIEEEPPQQMEMEGI